MPGFDFSNKFLNIIILLKKENTGKGGSLILTLRVFDGNFHNLMRKMNVYVHVAMYNHMLQHVEYKFMPQFF